jgi:hypothetical protein
MLNSIYTAFNGVAAISRGIEYVCIEHENSQEFLANCSITQMIPFISKITFNPELSIYQKLAGYSFSLIAVIAKSSPDRDLRSRISIPIDMVNALLCSTLAYKFFVEDTTDLTSIMMCGFNAGCAADAIIRMKRHFFL